MHVDFSVKLQNLHVYLVFFSCFFLIFIINKKKLTDINILALDPAGPEFEEISANRLLDRTDAEFT